MMFTRASKIEKEKWLNLQVRENSMTLQLKLTILSTITSVEASLVDTSTAAFSCTVEKCSFIASILLFHLVFSYHVNTVQGCVLYSLNFSDDDRGGLVNFISYLFVLVCVSYRIQRH